MKLIDAVLIRLETIMKDKNASLYSLNRDGGIAKSTLSNLLTVRKITIKYIRCNRTLVGLK